MKYLLDTNICTYIINQKPQAVFQKFRKYLPGEVGVSTITVAELQYGVHNSSRPMQNKQALIEFLLPLEIADFTSEAARGYGEIRAQLETQGTPIGALDMFIAAQARTLNLVLVTNNVKEFERVPELSVENWIS